jgi:hypothetical protein
MLFFHQNPPNGVSFNWAHRATSKKPYGHSKKLHNMAARGAAEKMTFLDIDLLTQSDTSIERARRAEFKYVFGFKKS